MGFENYKNINAFLRPSICVASQESANFINTKRTLE